MSSTTTTRPTQTKTLSQPTGLPSASDQPPASTISDTTPKIDSSGRDRTTGTDQHVRVTNGRAVGSGPVSLAPASETAPSIERASGRVPSSSAGQFHLDTHSSRVGADALSDPAANMLPATPNGPPSRRDADLLLYLYADQLNDIEDLRIRTENRLRTLFADDEWGKGVPADLPAVQGAVQFLEDVKRLEKATTLSLQRAMRAHYLGPWCKATVGVGEKQLGRLLAVIGDPATRAMPSQLWAYCGLHVIHPGQPSVVTQRYPAGVDPTSDPDQRSPGTQIGLAGVAPSRTRGQKANWSTEAKTRTYLIAESCIKQRTSLYRRTYDDGRAKYADAVHAHSCKRCGPKGKPAEPGSPLSLGHQHARAMRLVMKAILLDLWKQSRQVPA